MSMHDIRPELTSRLQTWSSRCRNQYTAKAEAGGPYALVLLAECFCALEYRGLQIGIAVTTEEAGHIDFPGAK